MIWVLSLGTVAIRFLVIRSAATVVKLNAVCAGDRAGGAEAVEIFGDRFRGIVGSLGVVVGLMVICPGNLHLFLYLARLGNGFELLGGSLVNYLDLRIGAVKDRVSEITDAGGHTYLLQRAAVYEAFFGDPLRAVGDIQLGEWLVAEKACVPPDLLVGRVKLYGVYSF